MQLVYLGGESTSKTSRWWLTRDSMQDKAGKVTELPPVTMNFGEVVLPNTFISSILEGSDMLVFVFQKEKARC